MAEPIKNKKPSLRQLMDNLDEDDILEVMDEYSSEDQLEKEYKEWSLKQSKSGNKGSL